MINQDPALIWHGRSLSWEQLRGYVHSTARRLKEFGLKKGQRVLVEGVAEPGTVILALSLWRIGVVFCPFNPRLTADMFSDLCDRVMPCLVLKSLPASCAFIPVRPALRKFTFDDVICVEPVEHFFAGDTDARSGWSYLDNDEATIIMTAGSTGLSKAVLHTFGAHCANARGASACIPFGAGDTWLLSLPLWHISGLAVIFRALLNGGAMAFPGEVSLAEALVRFRPTHISLVSAQLKQLLALASRPLAALPLKALLLGGGPLPEGILRAAVEQHLPVYCTYGLTETASQVATSKYSGRAEAALLPEREVRVHNGIIEVRGPILCKGYVNGDTLIQPFDADGWFATNDKGTLNEAGLVVEGRADRMFVSGGENVYPETVERVLLSYPGIAQAKVFPQSHDVFGTVVAAQVVLFPEVALDERTLQVFLQTQLLVFQRPREIIVVASIEKSVSFKD